MEKTVLSYAAAVNKILGTGGKSSNDRECDKILLFKSNDIIGGKERQEGFRKGSQYEKYSVYLKSYVDAHKACNLNSEMSFEEMLQHPDFATEDFAQRQEGRNKIGGLYVHPREAAIEIEYLQFARGRTFENSIIIVDEAQNYSPFEMKQLIERVGMGSKIILVGDPKQIDDRRRLSEDFNGLTFAANVLYGEHPRMSIIALDQNYRGQAAEIMRSKNAPNL